jgi:hypothetical protein
MTRPVRSRTHSLPVSDSHERLSEVFAAAPAGPSRATSMSAVFRDMTILQLTREGSLENVAESGLRHGKAAKKKPAPCLKSRF